MDKQGEPYMCSYGIKMMPIKTHVEGAGVQMEAQSHLASKKRIKLRQDRYDI